MTKGDVLNHLIQTSQQMRQSGDTSNADILDQKIMQIKSDPRHKDLNQPLQGAEQAMQSQQLSPNKLGNSPTNVPNQQAIAKPQQVQIPQNSPQLNLKMPQQQAQSDPNDINNIVHRAMGAGRQLNPNLIQGLGGILSTLGGGTPYESPSQKLGMEAAKANVSVAPYKLLLAQSVMNKNQNQAGQAEANTEYLRERTKGAKFGNQLLDGASGGVDSNGQPIDLQLSSVSTGARGGVTMKNMNELSKEKGIGAIVKPWQQQNAKVDAGLHALRVMDQGFDRNTGQFNIASMNQGELNQSLGALIAGQGPSSDASRESLRQGSLAGTLTQKINYLTGGTSNVVTPQIAKLIHQTLIGQIKQSAQERQPYDDALQTTGNDPNQYFQQSPSYQYYYGGNQGGQQQPQQGGQQGDQQVGKYVIH